ncbi:hypothetical protein GH5_06394 [Leishmania sp. Ghana 2012 LV757]|uniref:hypothetical protein n=1 Tax=Leishmania sp. Ghana 2012 LV757 TaxID=2803181 RepID=UPI001B5ED89A|nr:hypothetical protein GH5_06394 [Leishmania sp. Ghana 2012 LV757]
MEIDFLEMQLMDVLALHHDDDVNDDDVAFATFDYIRGAHVVALALLLEGRLPEVQRCLHLCQAACGETAVGHAAAASSEAAAAPSATYNASGPLNENVKAADSWLKLSLPSPSLDAAVAQRRPLRVLRSDEDRQVLSALTNRTAQLQKQLEAARRARQGCDTDSRLHKLSLGHRDDVADETMDTSEATSSMRLIQRHLQQLPRAAPMTLALRPAFIHGARDGSARTSATRPPPPTPRLSAPVEDRRGESTPLRLPSLVTSRSPGNARQQVASTAPDARHRMAMPPPPPPERGIAIGGRSYLYQRKVRKGLPPLITAGRTLCVSRCRTRALSSGALNRQLQSNGRVETLEAEDRAAEDVDDTRAAQLSDTVSEKDMLLYSCEVQKLPHLWNSSTRSSTSSSKRGPLHHSAAVTRPSPTSLHPAAQHGSRTLAVDGTDENEGEDVSPVHGGDVRGDAGGRAGLAPVQTPHTRELLRTTSSLRWLAVINHGPQSVQSPSSLEECVMPRRRVLPVPPVTHLTASSAANEIAPSVPLLLDTGRGLLGDDAYGATSAPATSLLTPRSVLSATPNTTSEQLPLPSSATAIDILPPLTRLVTPSSTASAAAAHAVQVARQTMQFALTSLNAQLRCSAKALERCDQLALSRLPYSASEALLATRARQAADECVNASRGTGGSGGSGSSARIASPVSAAGLVVPAVGAAAAVTVAALPQGDCQSEEDGVVSPASFLRSDAGASPPMPALLSPHSRTVATTSVTVTCPLPTIDAVSSEEKGVRDSASEGSSVLLGAADKMRPVPAVTSYAERAVEGAQEGGDEAGEGVSVAPVAMSTKASPRARPSGARDAAGHYTYNAAVEALVCSRLAVRPAAVPQPQTKAPEAAVLAAAVEESSPGTAEEALVAWRRMLQSIGSVSTATTVVGDPSADARKLNAAMVSSPSQTPCCLVAIVVAPPHGTLNGGVRRMRHGIHCATDVVRGRETQRIVCEALRQASQHVPPGDLVRPTWKTGGASCPKQSLLDLLNVLPSRLDGAEASAKTWGHAVRRNTGETTIDMSFVSESCTSPSTSTGAAPSRRRPPQVSGGEDAMRCLPLCLGAAGTPLANVTLARPSTAAVADVLRQLHKAHRASAALLGIHDWTVVAPGLLTRSLPLSLRAVRIQRWWRQRLAARLCRQRRAAQEAYLVEEERRDAAALRLQQQMRLHWAREALARCAAACVAWTEHRVTAERTSPKHGNVVDSLTGGGIAFDGSNSFTTMPPPHGHLGRVVAPHAFESGGGALLSKQMHRAHPIRIRPAAGTNGSLAGLGKPQEAAPAGADKNTFLFFSSARAAAAPDDDDALDSNRGPCGRVCRSPLIVSTGSSLAAKRAEAVASLSVHNGTTSEQKNAAAHRIQRCYRHHLHMARLCRDVEVLSAVVTRRVPLAAIRLTLTAAPLSASAALSSMEHLPSDSVDGGVAEFSVISLTSGGTSRSPHSLLDSSATSSHTYWAQDAAKDSDAAMMRNLLDHCTGDVYEAYLKRGLAARRHGDYKTPLERVSLRDLQRIRQEREVEAVRHRQLYEREQQRKLEQQQRRERQALDASKVIQRIGRGCRWRRWLRGRELGQRADPHEVEWLSRSIVGGLHNVKPPSAKGLGTQPVMSLEEKQCAQLAGGEAVASHMISRLQAAHPQCFGIATSPTSVEFIASHCTPAQLASVATTEAFVAAFASCVKVYSRYRYTCARRLQLAWRLHRAKLHSRRKQGRLV